MKNTIKEIKLKDGTVFPVGTECEISFVGNGSPLATIKTSSRDFKVSCANLPKYFKGFKVPSMASLERYSDDGVCPSVLGKRVEPDGWDDEGSPSWLLALGLI
jgi:hypothetical protein